MFYGLYDAETGKIRQCLGGPSRDWAAIMALPGELIIESDFEIDNSIQIVNVNTYPHSLLHYTPTPSLAELRDVIVTTVQRRLDAFAQSRGYDSILSAATYAASSVPQFQAEGQRAVALRDRT